MIDRLLDHYNRRLPNPKLRSILLHMLFWMVWLSRTLYDIKDLWDWNWSLLYIAVIFICQAPLVYIHLYVLVPRLLNKRHYVAHFISIGSLIYLYSFCNYSILMSLPREGMPDIMLRFLGRIKPNFDMLEGMIVVILTYALKYTLIAFITQTELLKLQKEKLQLELNALKAQIHPHFLFNTLNNLYSLTLKNSEKASEVVLKLSDIMRYVLYQANEQQVDLKKEIEFAKNYVDLQRIRYQDKYNITFETTGDCGELKVAPLLFIDFIENAFKHGLERRFNDGFVSVVFNIEDNLITLIVINSKGQNDEDLPAGNTKRKGIGLQNVQRRLDLIYGETHQLKIAETEETFEINLSLQLS